MNIFSHINIIFTSTSNHTPSLYVVILYLLDTDDNNAGLLNSGFLTVNGPALKFPTGLKKYILSWYSPLPIGNYITPYPIKSSSVLFNFLSYAVNTIVGHPYGFLVSLTNEA